MAELFCCVGLNTPPPALPPLPPPPSTDDFGESQKFFCCAAYQNLVSREKTMLSWRLSLSFHVPTLAARVGVCVPANASRKNSWRSTCRNPHKRHEFFLIFGNFSSASLWNSVPIRVYVRGWCVVFVFSRIISSTMIMNEHLSSWTRGDSIHSLHSLVSSHPAPSFKWLLCVQATVSKTTSHHVSWTKKIYFLLKTGWLGALCVSTYGSVFIIEQSIA